MIPRPARPLARAAALVLVLAIAAATAAGDDDPLAPAIEAFRAGDYTKAVELAGSVPEADPSRAKAAFVVGEASLALQLYTDAANAFREILKSNPSHVPALVGLGRAQYGGGDPTEALLTLNKAVKLDPKDAGARRALGELWLAKEDFDKARGELETAVKLAPKDPLASRSYVEALLKGDRVNDAAKEAERLVKALPDHPMGYFLNGYVLDRQGRDKDAIAQYEKACAKDDKFLDAHKNVAILCITKNPGYSDKERTQKALEHFRKYFELGGKDEELKKSYEQIKTYLDSKDPKKK